MQYKIKYTEGMDIRDTILELRGITDEWDKTMILNHTSNWRVFDIPERDRIKELLWGDKSVLIFGDYDVDGITAAQIAKRYIPKAQIYIPERRHGYGLTKSAAETICDLADVILTVDCGITSAEAIEYLVQHGKDVIVTDHHMVQEAKLPKVPIIHPQLMQLDFKSYSGSAVIYKAMQELTGKHDPASLQLACLGTICDVMPLIDENRGLVQRGLKAMNDTPIVPILAIKEVLGKDAQELTEGDIGFYVGPMINACGRMGRADVAMSLMSATSVREALVFANMAKEFNVQRREMTQALTESAESYLVYDGSINVYVFADALDGMAGLIANGLVGKHGKPTIVLIRDEDIYRGSMRSPSSVDCSAIVAKLGNLLISGGGHKGAAGVVLHRDNLRLFLDEIKGIGDALPVVERYGYVADIQVDKASISGIIHDVQQLRPYGNGFEAPVFTTKLYGEKINGIGAAKNHTRITEGGIDYLIFNMSPKEVKQKTGGGAFHVAFKIDSEVNPWTGRPSMIVETIEELQ